MDALGAIKSGVNPIPPKAAAKKEAKKQAEGKFDYIVNEFLKANPYSWKLSSHKNRKQLCWLNKIDTFIRDNSRQLLECHYGPKT
jgi:hypothetical protein